MWILKYLGLGHDAPSAGGDADTEAVRRIVGALDRLEPDRARRIAAFAYVLGRVAHANLEISAEETRAMEEIIEERMGLGKAESVLTVQIAKTQCTLFGSTENFLVTREYGALASREEKLALLECAFLVSAADREISVAEDNEIRRISNELRLSHGDFIAVRSRYREHLAVLKGPADGSRE